MANKTGQHQQYCESVPEQCPHVSQAADAAVKKVFAILGVDIAVPKEVEQFRMDLRFGARMRRASDRGTVALIVAIVSSGVAAIFALITSAFKGWHG